MKRRTTNRRSIAASKQRGIVVLVILLTLGITLASVFIFSLSRGAVRLQNDAQTAATLAQAKEALLGYAVSHSTRPGSLPFPDRSADGNYDGNSDCPPLSISNNLLLGKLPGAAETAPCLGPTGSLGFDQVDGGGEHLWYAVSRNLLRAPAGSINLPLSLSGTGNWLTVHDSSGAVLSNQAAFVLMAPGSPVAAQDRAGPAPSPDNFLDEFVAGSTYRNWDSDLDFITATDTTVSSNGSNQFNDKLLYMTRDEYRAVIAKRVAGDLKNWLNAKGAYPFAAPAADGECVLSPPSSGFVPIKDAFPFFLPDCFLSNGFLTGLPAWFTEWEPYVSYTRISASAAKLTIFGKDFTVTP